MFEGVKIGVLVYSLNKKEKTASVTGNDGAPNQIIIPRSIIYDSKEYIVTSISEGAFSFTFKIESIQFPPDSEVRTIEKESFTLSKINNLTIPSSLIELKEGWCAGISNLNNINIMPNNRYFIYLNNDFIIGKIDKKSNEYDYLIFSRCNIETAIIPSFIKKIGPFAFSFCKKLQKVEIQNDSKLEIIEKEAFSYSSIESISLPPNLTQICEKAFFYCQQLKKVEIPNNSELQIIEENAFSNSMIEKIFLPKRIQILNQNIFNNCQQLRNVEIPNDSKLQTIDAKVFEGTSIESISIPSNLTELKEKWCSGTPNLIKIKVNENNPLYSSYENKFIIKKSSISDENYDILVFCVRNIKETSIPDFIKIIGPDSFEKCKELRKIEVSSNSKLQSIENRAFFGSSIENLIISNEVKYRCIKFPPHLTKINLCAFFECQKIQRVEFAKNSIIQSLGDLVFSKSSIERISIAPSINSIGIGTFSYCSKLDFIEIPKNSELVEIKEKAFVCSSIKCLYFPPHLTKISKDAFASCNELQIIEIDENSEITCINIEVFSLCEDEPNLMIPSTLRDRINFCKNDFYSDFD